MRVVLFPYEEDANGSLIYPDDKSLFKNTRIIPGRSPLMVYGNYYGQDSTIADFDVSTLPKPIGKRTIYSKVDFINKIPRAIRKQIRAAELSGIDYILDWTFIVGAMNDVDLNNLPSGFVAGLEDMANGSDISIDMNAVDNFLER